MNAPIDIPLEGSVSWDRWLPKNLFHLSLSRWISLAFALGIPLSILTAPFMAVALMTLIVKPEGPLSPESNTLFWALASTASGLAVVGGVAGLVWFFRVVRYVIYALDRQRVQIAYPDLAAELLLEADMSVDEMMEDRRS